MPSSWWAEAPLWEVLDKVQPAAVASAGTTPVTRAARRLAAYGTAVRFEGYTVPWHVPVGAAHLPDAVAMSREARRSPHMVPIRLLVGADRAGAAYISHRLQDQPAHVSLFPPGDELGRPGAVTAALRRLTAAVTGVPVPAAEPWAEPGR